MSHKCEHGKDSDVCVLCATEFDDSSPQKNMSVENEIIIDGQGNACVIGKKAHILWNYCKGEFPRTKCCHNNFYVMELCEFTQGWRWDIKAGQTSREDAERYMTPSRVLVDVTNAPIIGPLKDFLK